ncbi:hypothetical protein SAMN04487948_103203 [Halogranum amylolyticum]|uniref:Uncharacterized protein n=1 Tax=Halogranum amylolyticum TaxID=660520 RepID=A0A1H8QMH3_9EURY|nr:hypothetical protein [Halogranum amylolyticum]SEO55420.1 hypothetical protein SAMN04487948_103203 [Halogranum amylolyticum]
MTETAHGDPVTLDLSPEEAWVLHTAVLAAVERAVENDQSVDCRVNLLETVEGERVFTPDELQSLRTALQTYFGDAPDRDRETAISVLAAVDAALG